LAKKMTLFCSVLASLTGCLAGALVAGSVVLLGGDPGIGKSTLLLQAVARLAASKESILRQR
jgi:DNA repair protein RadA/Sms